MFGLRPTTDHLLETGQPFGRHDKRKVALTREAQGDCIFIHTGSQRDDWWPSAPPRHRGIRLRPWYPKRCGRASERGRAAGGICNRSPYSLVRFHCKPVPLEANDPTISILISVSQGCQ